MFGVTLYSISLALLIASFMKDQAKTKKALKIAWKAFNNILPNILFIVLLIGAVMAVLPPEYIQKFFGHGDIWSTLLIAGVGAVTIIPGFVAFPLAASLLRAGAGVMQVSAFITTLMMVGVITAPMEMKYFGKRFTVTRNLLSFFFALLIGHH